jgi:hypothetical protein
LDRFIIKLFVNSLIGQRKLIMTLFQRMEAAEAALKVLQNAAAQPPVADTALEARVAVLEGEIGQPSDLAAPSA